jgi:hypothetical protein
VHLLPRSRGAPLPLFVDDVFVVVVVVVVVVVPAFDSTPDFT